MEFEAGTEHGVQPEVFPWRHATEHAERTGSGDSTPSTELGGYDLAAIFDDLGEPSPVEPDVEAYAGRIEPRHTTEDEHDLSDMLDPGAGDFSFEECVRWFEGLNSGR